ncbi:MAG TPA: transglutaminase-like domain-containing protein [Isosphaeraceae bacterium]|nr:transglutaminase-like domain-containing protein [Isosphaeraceae bacterium]
MVEPFEGSPEFRRLLQGDGADLARLALEIAGDAGPGLDPGPYLAAIDGYAERVRDRCPEGASLRAILGQINWVLFVEEGFRGNDEDYYDPANSYLDRVIDRKLGIPISLSALYLAVADRVGLGPETAGVNLPGHFVVRAGRGDSTVFVDPFHEGAFLDREGCERLVRSVTGQAVTLAPEQLEPCPTAVLVARMLRNLKAIYLRRGEFVEALPVLQRLVALLPDEPLERRDLGMTCLRADRPGAAIEPLAAYLDALPDADDAPIVREALRQARRDVAERN